MSLKRNSCSCVEWVELAQNKVQLRIGYWYGYMKSNISLNEAGIGFQLIAVT
jgi:hypothetical protein